MLRLVIFIPNIGFKADKGDADAERLFIGLITASKPMVMKVTDAKDMKFQ